MLPRTGVPERYNLCVTVEDLPDWERLLAAERHLQSLVPGAVLVGGTAAALHAGHRKSLDGDHVLEIQVGGGGMSGSFWRSRLVGVCWTHSGDPGWWGVCRAYSGDPGL